MNKVLPIGSIVLLTNGTKPVMIFGYMQESRKDENGFVDYIGVPYPEGNINASLQIGFQMDDIREVLFEGYRSEEFRPFELLLKLAETRYLGSEESNTED